MAFTFRKQFIAGARCPACAAVDTLQLWTPVQEPATEAQRLPKRMHCVQCGHDDVMQQEAGAASILVRSRPE